MNTDTTIASYREVLAPFLHEMQQQNPDVEFTCVGDNAPCHYAVRARHWLDQHDIPCIPLGGHPVNSPGGYPPNSPDLSPIELCFNTLKEKVQSRSPTTTRQLMQVVEQEWRNFSLTTIQNNYRKMVKVYQFVDRHNGEEYQC